MPRLSRIARVFRLRDAAQGAAAPEVDEELRFHVECRVDELVACGVPADEARATARREFGDWHEVRRDVLLIDRRFAREVRMRDRLDSLWSDVRHAWRALRARPGFTITAVVTLALGIGATTTVVSVVDGALLRPLPYANAGRIVHVGERASTEPGAGGTTSFDNFDDWRRTSRSFSAIGIAGNAAPTMTGQGDPVRLRLARVSHGIFDVFHVVPYRGRGIVEADEQAGAEPVIVLSYDLWKSRFGADPGVIGRSVALNFTPARIVGILPPGFAGTGRLARPAWTNFVNDTSDGRSGRSTDVYGLLRPGVSVAQAQDELTRISDELARRYPADDKGQTAVVDPLLTLVVGGVRRPLLMLLAASLLVLLIACANVSNLLLARGASRERELAVRAAIGADRRRIVRLLITESGLLAALGCIAGVLAARGAMAVIIADGPSLFGSRRPELDPRVLAIALLVAIGTALAFGLAPALRFAPRNPQRVLRTTGTRMTDSASRTRAFLAATQLALAVVLLSASALVVKSFARVLRVDPGIRPDHLLTMQITLPAVRYDSTRSTIFYQRLAARIRAMPGVRGAAVTSLVPFSGDFDRIGITDVAGQPTRQGSDALRGDRYVVSPSYFATMGVRLLRGRLLSDDDRMDAPTVCLVDEVFARRSFGNADPIGMRMRLPDREGYATVVGVVAHVKTYGLDADSPGQIYMSNAQWPWRWSALVVRTADDPLALAQPIIRVVHDMDAEQPVDDVASMDSLMADLLRGRRFTLALLGAFAAVAIALAVIGLYGVIAYGVAQRRREFGVRVALGARAAQIAGTVIAEASRIAAAGAAIGILGALLSARLIASLLFEVNPRDPWVLAAVVSGLIAVALSAAIVPAMRAMRVDPTEVLRGD